MNLDLYSQRVLGALMEKEMTTPENYPLSLNSLINACNQRSSREPVLDLDEEQVRQALHGLEDLGLVAPTRDARVPKYEHRIRTVLNLRRDETALVCLLLLRGPQTPGELRSRSDRMHSFDDLGSVVSALERLAMRPAGEGEGPLTVQMARQPGAREARYAHLLGGAVEVRARDAAAGSGPGSNAREESSELGELRERIQVLEARMTALETALDSTKSS